MANENCKTIRPFQMLPGISSCERPETWVTHLECTPWVRHEISNRSRCGAQRPVCHPNKSLTAILAAAPMSRMAPRVKNRSIM
jgi:hypothetical protein